MRTNGFILSIALLIGASPSFAATFGSVVTTVGGHPADIALDESRSQLYIANFTALQIDVMSTKDNTIHRSIPLQSHPSGVALSSDGTYLLVTQYQNGTTTPQGFEGLTVINLNTNASQTFSTGDPALGVAFVRTGQDVGQNAGQALIATSTGFYLFDPVSGRLQFLASYANVVQALPVPQATIPSQIVQTQLTTSADGLWIWGLADGGTGTQLVFRFDARKSVFNGEVWTTAPPLLPRVSSAADGSWAMIGWSQFAPAMCDSGLMIKSRYPQSIASTSITGHAVNSKNGVTDTIYAQVFDPNQPLGPPYYSSTSTKFPTLSIMDADNLTVRDKVYLPESIVGRSLLDSAGNNMYAITDSGVTVLPVGSLSRYPRLATSQEDVLVQTNFCVRTALTTTFKISDPGNNATDFSISTTQAGVSVSPSSGKAPATITVTVQAGAIPNPGGTLAVPLVISSGSAVNIAPSVRLLISNPDLDQRGTIINVPGQVVDLLADTARNHFYVMRQDKNQVLVFDGSSYQQLAILRTNTTPTGMSFSGDGKYLIVASKDSQLLQMIDLDSFQVQTPIQLPASHYGASVAQSNVGSFAVVQDDSGKNAIDRFDLPNHCAYTPTSLGIFKNDPTVIPSTSVLSPSADQNSILVASPTGSLMLYDATHDTFILSRKDLTSLSGAYAVSSGASASSSGPAFATRYVVGDNIFDSALVPQGTMDTTVGHTSGFVFTGPGGYRLTGSTASAPGVIQNLPNILQATNVRPVRTVEAPLLTSTGQPFTRTVAPLANGIVTLTTSGITVLANNYDAAVVPPAISSVVNAADGTQPVASGGLISVFGAQLSPVNIATQQIPLPTALGQSCLSVNGVPVPLLFVSSKQINAQLPYNVSGGSSLTIHTPGGISDAFNFSVLAAAPRVFMSGSAGPQTGLATIVRADNNQLITPTNPIHPKDTVVIYLTGMGATFPAQTAGLPAPSDPLAQTTIDTSVTLGGQNLAILYAGLVPDEVGVYQINATVPFSGVPLGLSIPLTITQGSSSTTINVRVVN
ncbi:MAG TPA: hypothetical protein VG456_23340 [Candidatus Sulfopaludibacter sp.]|jgi:uncharacterized protein (TIGR03437 family)|nr:hypothetical protein [Candidatus Sulfopaludibacter sp.]